MEDFIHRPGQKPKGIFNEDIPTASFTAQGTSSRTNWHNLQEMYDSYFGSATSTELELKMNTEFTVFSR